VTSNRVLVPLAIVAGIVLIVIGIVYCVDTANSLPSFFPGHESAPTTDHHIKHGLLAFALALGCFVFVWFRTGPKSGEATSG
jgi:amino acid permease